VRNEESEWCDVISGVPQGSVLGFVVHINDLLETVKSLIFLFADGTKLFCSILDIVQLQADADNFFEWSKTWLQIINNKCMRIGISSVTSHSYVIDDEHLCSTTVEKDLGVVVDQSLRFHQHCY